MENVSELSRTQLHKVIGDLKQALIDAKRVHLVVDEDYFYSCPLGVDDEGFKAYCGDETKCNCGTEAHNAKIDEAIARIFKRD